jgi:gas vesicle protein
MIGLLAGTAIGAGLALWLAPRAKAEYERASARVGDAVDELKRTGQGVRDDLADAVVRGAHQVEGFAKAAKSA